MKEIINEFSNKHVLVIGDIMLDEFLVGDIVRINPEAPVPILNVKKRFFKPGGAANVANNIVSLGARCTLIGKVGKDEACDILIDEFEKAGIEHRLIKDEGYQTIRKVRTIARNQQIVRIDFEDNKNFVSGQDEKVIETILSIKDIDVIIISDYDKGLISTELLNCVRKLGIKIVADFKPCNIHMFNDIHLITPNLKEAQKMSGIFERDNKSVELIGKELVRKLNTNVLITRSEDGMSLFELNGDIQHIPTEALEVCEVCGAGDTVVSALSLALISGATLGKAAIIANAAAGIVIGKMGTATTTQREILARFDIGNRKLKTLEELKSIVNNLKLKGEKIVFTNGCFDILHSGHAKLLKKAKSFGDKLILGLNSDDSIRRMKGENRPINSEEDRADVLSALESVDYIVVFEEDTPLDLIGVLLPDVLVKGSDYDISEVMGGDIVFANGGEVRLVELTEGKSTTGTIKKIRDSLD